MAKYLIPLVPLLCLALDNNNIYVRSHTSSHEADSLPLTRAHFQQHPRRQVQLHVQHTSQELQQHHTHQHRDRQPKHLAPDPTGGEEGNFTYNQHHQLEHYQRLRRHLQRQRDHMLQQERSYHRISTQTLKHSPNLWQVLSQGYHIDGPVEEMKTDQESELVNNAEMQSASDMLNFSQMFNDASATSPESKTEEVNDYQKYSEGNFSDFAKELQQLQPESIMSEHVEPASALNNSSIYPKIPSGGCSKCESSRKEEHITEEELRRLRIEFVKQQILEKLRLKESPNVSAVELPLPIFEGITLPQTNEGDKNKDFDDYYARTNQKFILLQRGKLYKSTPILSYYSTVSLFDCFNLSEETECRRLGAHPSMCFSFKIGDADVDGFEVNSAVLWLYKNNQNYTKVTSGEDELNGRSKKQTLVVSEVEQQQLDSKYLPLAKTIAIQSVNVQGKPVALMCGSNQFYIISGIFCTAPQVNASKQSCWAILALQYLV